MALTVGSRLGHYDVTALIGEGGMGQVYQATDTKLHRQVALKILPEAFATDPDRLARFQREAQVLASLNHPNIASIHGLEESDGTRALVLELVEGPTLADRIAPGPIPVDEALAIAKQIAEALEAAHEAGVIHRDLKPANIKVKDDGVVKVLDFGLARAFQPDAVSGDASLSPTLTAAATQAGLIMGTAAYMAPEQAKGKPVDKRVDIWAFGAVVYEMLTGRSAFTGEDVADTLAFVLTKQIDWTAVPSGAPDALRHLLQRCLERNPKQRLRDIGDARADIDDLLTGAVALQPTESITTPTERQYSLSTMLATALALATLVGIGVWNLTLPERDGVLRFYGLAQGTELVMQSSRQPVAISPDGQSLAFATAGSPNQLHLRSVDQLDHRTVPGIGDPWNPFFSPDSEWLGFLDGTTLKRVSVRGGPATAIVEIGGTGLHGASWASDDTIVFATNDTATGLLRVKVEGGEVEVLTVPTAQGFDIDHRFPQVLPGADQVLFTIINTGGSVDDAQIRGSGPGDS